MRSKPAVSLPTAALASELPYFSSLDAVAAFQHYTPIVERLAAADIVPCRADLDLANINVARGIASFEGRWDALATRLTDIDVPSLRELPSLVRATLYADGRIAGPARKEEIHRRLAALRPMRATALKQLDVLGDLSIVPAVRVSQIRSGSGPIDSARDAVDIVGLMREYEGVIGGRHPLSAQWLDELTGHGNWLLGALTPDNAAPQPAVPSAETQLRDRLFTELVRRHDELRRAGAAEFGLRELDAKVPPLRSSSRASAPSAPPAPTSPPDSSIC